MALNLPWCVELCIKKFHKHNPWHWGVISDIKQHKQLIKHDTGRAVITRQHIISNSKITHKNTSTAALSESDSTHSSSCSAAAYESQSNDKSITVQHLHPVDIWFRNLALDSPRKGSNSKSFRSPVADEASGWFSLVGLPSEFYTVDWVTSRESRSQNWCHHGQQVHAYKWNACKWTRLILYWPFYQYNHDHA